MHKKKTKIICTLGPSSDSITEIENLIGAGMNVARLNFSHGNYEDHSKILKNLRAAERRAKTRIAILQDLQGPKIRIGEMPEGGLRVSRGDKVIFTKEEIIGHQAKKETTLPVQYKNLFKDVNPKERILIDDGIIELKVLSIKKELIECQVISGGLIKRHKGINCPDSTIKTGSITEKDKKDLLFGLKNGVDYVALSFVKSKKDILELKDLIAKAKGNAKVIAKIERREALENLDEIVKNSDAIMIARGDLGVEIPAEQVPLAQRKIIQLCNKYAKPVITATQVLQSMVENPIATRAEISDAATAVYEHCDAIMLSNESAVGKYPTKATKTLTKVSLAVEKELEKDPELLQQTQIQFLTDLDSLCLNACDLASESDAKYIVCFSENGYTPAHLARFRPYTPIITITPKEKTARFLSLNWGINEVLVEKIKVNDSKKTEKIIKLLTKAKLIKKADEIVLLCNASKKEHIISLIKI